MTPIEFENYIADFYSSKGYSTVTTPRSYDYGVDIIASSEKEKIAIQVKMYAKRPVNYKDIMYLYAGKDYYDCSSAILHTLCPCDPLAIQVAKKLNITIFENTHIENIEPPSTTSFSLNDFETIWNHFIKPLKNQKIYTLRGEENKILDVTSDYLKRQSSTGRISKIEKQIFKIIYYRLKERKEITRKEINTEYPGRASSIITVVLAKIPFITVIERPIAKLIFKI